MAQFLSTNLCFERGRPGKELILKKSLSKFSKHKLYVIKTIILNFFYVSANLYTKSVFRLD